ncbi:MAG: isopentenyl-diphosphate Delta-isomerase [Woeseiaceae bacterium]|nr:isopentenyl-diphosphate Delta-isomerase [Woeseiaceae bacterium]MDX2609110.1 isopentenyl-diphosphate Delta-isomerase [Woeseiaceae bacterium]
MNSAHRIVSSEAEELILVDADDNETGFLSKADCHAGAGVLHRAFSLFLFNDKGELLLQQRSQSKRLWPGFWSNSCCSHPRRGESMQVATQRRLLDELNIETPLEYVYKFSYEASFGDLGSENELCQVYLGKVGESVRANAHEIADIRYVSAAALAAEMDASAERLTPWFKMEWQTLLMEHKGILASYCGD